MSVIASAGRFETYDIEEQGQAARPWEIVHRQMSPGNFRASTEYVRFNGILCYRQHWARRTLVKGATPSGFLTLGCSYTPETHVQWCGLELDTQNFALAHSASEIEYVIPENSDHWWLLIPYDVLLRHINHAPRESKLFGDTRHLVCDPESGRVLAAWIPDMIEKYRLHPELLEQEQERKRLESKLLKMILQCANSDVSDAQDISPHKRNLVFCRALEFAEGLLSDLPITVPEFAEEVGVSQRVLEVIFNEKLGITPKKFLRRFRLNQAYRELLSVPGKKFSTVTEVAFRYGFTELGRFAVEYKRMFGESPSTTLTRKMSTPPKGFADLLLS